MATALLDLRNTTQELTQVTFKQTRLFWNYYRVALYGKAMKELEGKEWIYKEPMMVLKRETERRHTY